MSVLIQSRPIAACVARGEVGMSTAEYAVGTVSACGFAGLLCKLRTSDFGQNFLEGILSKITGLLPF